MTLARRRNRAFTLDPVNLVFLKQELHALCVRINYAVLVTHHRFQIELHVFRDNAHRAQMVGGFIIFFRGL